MLFCPLYPSENLRTNLLFTVYVDFYNNKVLPCFLSNFLHKCILTYDNMLICYQSPIFLNSYHNSEHCYIKHKRLTVPLNAESPFTRRSVFTISVYCPLIYFQRFCDFMLHIVTIFFFSTSTLSLQKVIPSYLFSTNLMFVDLNQTLFVDAHELFSLSSSGPTAN